MHQFEYEVFLLDDRFRAWPKGQAILGTDDLALACTYCYDTYLRGGPAIGVIQPSSGEWREIYAPWIKDELEAAELEVKCEPAALNNAPTQQPQ